MCACVCVEEQSKINLKEYIWVYYEEFKHQAAGLLNWFIINGKSIRRLHTAKQHDDSGCSLRRYCHTPKRKYFHLLLQPDVTCAQALAKEIQAEMWIFPKHLLKRKRSPLSFPSVRSGHSRWLFLNFPSGLVVKNRPANAVDTGSIPSLGRFHMPQATKPVYHSFQSPHTWGPVLHNQRRHCNEKPEHHK